MACSSSDLCLGLEGIAVHDLGGSGPPLLLCHANGLHGLVFRPLAKRLVSRFHCFSFDFRGHGDSKALPEHLRWGAFCDDVLTVVQRLALARPSAMGHSLGGTALLLAELARPGTFASIYCFEPIVLPHKPHVPHPEDNRYAAAALHRQETFGSRVDAEAVVSQMRPFSDLHPEALEAYVEHGLVHLPDGSTRLKCRPFDEARVFATASSHHGHASLSALQCRLVLAGGRKSRVVPPSVLGELLARLPKGRLELFDELGHFGPLQDPATVSKSVLVALAEADWNHSGMSGSG
jgi:pimeloyl-ACP methyl ester carboxylesterase